MGGFRQDYGWIDYITGIALTYTAPICGILAETSRRGQAAEIAYPSLTQQPDEFHRVAFYINCYCRLENYSSSSSSSFLPRSITSGSAPSSTKSSSSPSSSSSSIAAGAVTRTTISSSSVSTSTASGISRSRT